MTMDNARETDTGVNRSDNTTLRWLGLFGGTYAAALALTVVLAPAGPDVLTLVVLVILFFPIGLAMRLEPVVGLHGLALFWWFGYVLYTMLIVLGVWRKKMFLYFIFLCLLILNILAIWYL
jgi:hypothetical protein